jgi:threonine/homoserine/homoserine lactone efflux protein
LIGSIIWPYYACLGGPVQAMSVVHPFAFLGLAAVVIATPGPDTALTIRNTFSGGRAGGVCTALGVVVGQLAWVLATALGVAAAIATSETAFLLVRLLGAVYLVVLGFSTLRGRASREHPGVHTTPRPAVAARQGLVSNLTNPKAAFFFASLLPQFVSREGEPVLTTIVLGLAFALLTLGWLCAYVCAIVQFRRALAKPRLRRAFDLVTGAALVAFGCRLALVEPR